MSDKQRALPSWMTKKEEKVKEKQPLKSSRKRKTARTVFYCMNEKELVEAALSCLRNGASEDAPLPTHQQVKEKEDTPQKQDEPSGAQGTAKVLARLSEESTDVSEDLDATYVSETDLDVTEMETVPYGESPRRRAGSGGQRSGPARDPGGRVDTGVQAEDREERAKTPAGAAQDDDALRLLKEIFFS